jgi:hypothetical protein
MSSHRTIRYALSTYKNLIAEQIKYIEKTNNLATYNSPINKTVMRDFYKLKKYVTTYETIIKAMEITNYSELPIQK